jgi:hypothetical protein
VIKLASSFLSLLNRLWGAWDSHKLRQQGRQEAVKEAEDELQRQVDLAEYAVNTPDPDRDQRLRNRFDTAVK